MKSSKLSNTLFFLSALLIQSTEVYADTASPIAVVANNEVESMSANDRRIEVYRTPEGRIIFRNFYFNDFKLDPDHYVAPAIGRPEGYLPEELKSINLLGDPIPGAPHGTPSDLIKVAVIVGTVGIASGIANDGKPDPTSTLFPGIPPQIFGKNLDMHGFTNIDMPAWKYIDMLQAKLRALPSASAVGSNSQSTDQQKVVQSKSGSTAKSTHQAGSAGNP
jgi:hypothetical protein